MSAFIVAKRYLLSLTSCAYFFAGGVLQKKHRPLLYDLCKHFGFEGASSQQMRPIPLIPPVEVTDLFPVPITPTLCELQGTDGNVSLLELIIIASLAKQCSPCNVLEIGTFDGRTTANLALNTASDAKVYTLDLPPEGLDSAGLPLEADDRKYVLKSASGERFSRLPEGSKVKQLYGDSATFDFVPFEGKMDFIFIDGSHSYEYVLRDTRTALRLLPPSGGVILWHDYDTQSWPGLTTGLNELFQSEPLLRGIKHITSTSLCMLDTRIA
ncbi:TPA: hypothetical protein DDW35_00950 [Candidatus Sumerlaeota bacterium]|nr:hypothetical protein [Candidatus Sumerlaeota bacterium]